MASEHVHVLGLGIIHILGKSFKVTVLPTLPHKLIVVRNPTRSLAGEVRVTTGLKLSAATMVPCSGEGLQKFVKTATVLPHS